METLKAIATRKSVRFFKADPVEEELLHAILAAGFEAPSARNARPYHFYVIRNRQILDVLGNCAPTKRPLLTAPVGILVCADQEKQQKECFRQQDCSASTQNILLATHALGLGACWLGITPESEYEALVKKTLNLANQLQPIALIALGYEDGNAAAKENRFEKDKLTFID